MKKTYFASDFHLGTQGATSSKERERLIVQWLEGAMPDMHALYLVGDVWDYWFEYKQVVPKGTTRLLGSLLYGVSPLDAVTFGGAAAALVVATLLANWIPARRAASADPLAVLRSD